MRSRVDSKINMQLFPYSVTAAASVLKSGSISILSLPPHRRVTNGSANNINIRRKQNKTLGEHADSPECAILDLQWCFPIPGCLCRFIYSRCPYLNFANSRLAFASSAAKRAIKSDFYPVKTIITSRPPVCTAAKPSSCSSSTRQRCE